MRLDMPRRFVAPPRVIAAAQLLLAAIVIPAVLYGAALAWSVT